MFVIQINRNKRVGMLKKSLGLALVLVGVFVFQTAIAAEVKVTAKSIKMMKDAQALVNAGKYADAYALMEPYEFEKSGDITYDYLLGISAVNAGKPDRATLALERVESVSPQYGDVRLWLGIAYFQSGDSGRSKKAFEGLLKQTNLSAQSKGTAVNTLQPSSNKMTLKHWQRRKLSSHIWSGWPNSVSGEIAISPAAPRIMSMPTPLHSASLHRRHFRRATSLLVML